MIFGFTGTQDGMSDPQKFSLYQLFHELKEGENTFHFGDCVGADAEAFDIAEEFQFFTVSHPPVETILRAFKKASIVLEPKPYLERNKDIVDIANYLLATPKETRVVSHSGTWSTIRYAKSKGLRTAIILPNGEIR